jgi:hypothetical protein
MFAIADISSSNGIDEEIELLYSYIPLELVIGGDRFLVVWIIFIHPAVPTTTVVEKEELMCDVIYTLAKEIQRGTRSDWYPYTLII